MRMIKFIFAMSCGHSEEREVAEPSKYYQIDHDYYRAQGLCSACWAKLHESHRQCSQEMILEREASYD